MAARFGSLRLYFLVVLLLIGIVACQAAPATTPPTAPQAATVTAPTTAPQAATVAPTVRVAAPADREAALVEAAKKEGQLTIWSVSGEYVPQSLVKFQQRYPFIKINAVKLGNTEIAQRVLAENKAGLHNVDVIHVPVAQLLDVRKAELLEKYDWPNTAAWPKEIRTSGDGYYSVFMAVYNTVAYNTKLIAAKDAPTSWEALIDPKWKGKTVISLSPTEQLLLSAAMWGKDGKLDWDKATKYWDDFFRVVAPATTSSHTPAATMLAAGEYSLWVTSPTSVVTRMARDENAPIALTLISPIAGPSRGIAIVKNAPHPNAAKLLADYWTSTEGQVEFAEAAVQTPMDPKAVALSQSSRDLAKLDLFMLPIEVTTAENTKRSADYWNKMLGVK
ncbi:hypothetical protein ANRL1_01084 [Anaerolineae bacterium]|nr:hypothetical protein ANRL1_01084 [Anaerolineae bacterium]